jgi:hypothetical protein
VVCNADGTAECPRPDHGCNQTAGHCTCAPSTLACQGDDLVQCDADGAAADHDLRWL